MVKQMPLYSFLHKYGTSAAPLKDSEQTLC